MFILGYISKPNFADFWFNLVDVQILIIYALETRNYMFYT